MQRKQAAATRSKASRSTDAAGAIRLPERKNQRKKTVPRPAWSPGLIGGPTRGTRTEYVPLLAAEGLRRAHGFTARARRQGTPDVEIDRLGDEAGTAIAEQDRHSSRMGAAGTHQGEVVMPVVAVRH